MYPKLIVEVDCPCGRKLTVRTAKPEKEVQCWSCMRAFRVRLSKQGGYSIHVRDRFAQYYDEHTGRLDSSKYRQIFLER